jgi:hypothetical protein
VIILGLALVGFGALLKLPALYAIGVLLIVPEAMVALLGAATGRRFRGRSQRV